MSTIGGWALMDRVPLHDYILDVVQEEECLIWDVSVMDPQKWLEEYCDNIEAWKNEGTWINRVVKKMLHTYKE